MNDLADALARTIELLRRSKSSPWAWKSAPALLERLERELTALTFVGRCDLRGLKALFVPMGPLHELAVDNGWEDELVRLAEVVDAAE